jgi:hypothetical protein
MTTKRASLLCGVGAGAVGLAGAVHYWRAGLALAHYDARAHLVVARRVLDSLTPGWQQVGAVWLPLPHLLNLLPVQNDALYRSGASAIAISVLSMAVAAAAAAHLIHRATGSLSGGAATAALLMLNPDVLYLQSTPMTEPLLFGTTFLAVASIAAWCCPPSLAGVSSGETSTGSTKAAGWAIVAATLSRYEAWPIVAAAIALAFVVLVRRGIPVAAALRAVRGLAWWPLWTVAAFLVNSKVTVGAWFVSSGFFVPDNPALWHPWLAWTELWNGLVELTGSFLPWAAAASAIGVAIFALQRRAPRWAAATERQRSALLFVLALAACAALPWSAYVKGHPVRIRYDVPLVAAAAILTGAGVALLPNRIRPAVAVVAVTIAVWQAPPFQANAPVVVESQREAAFQRGREAVTTYLRAHWDGQPIMMSMGSLAHYMHDLSADGFAIADFLHEGNGEIWIHAVRHPSPYVDWIAIQEPPEGGDALFWQAHHDDNFLSGFERVAAGGNVALYRKRKDAKEGEGAKEHAASAPSPSFASFRTGDPR